MFYGGLFSCNGTQICSGKGDLMERRGWSWHPRALAWGSHQTSPSPLGFPGLLVRLLLSVGALSPCWPALLELASPQPVCCGLSPPTFLASAPAVVSAWQISQWGICQTDHLLKPIIGHWDGILTLKISCPGTGVRQCQAWLCSSAQHRHGWWALSLTLSVWLERCWRPELLLRLSCLMLI